MSCDFGFKIGIEYSIQSQIQLTFLTYYKYCYNYMHNYLLSACDEKTHARFEGSTLVPMGSPSSTVVGSYYS
jgi:hypothetical protein